MNLFLRILVIVFEILYYSLFMKFSRKEGSFLKYLILFTLFSVISFFMNDSSIISYVTILFIILYGLKYIVGLKITLYDLFFIFIMMLTKLFIELPCAIIATCCISNINVSKIILGILKNIIISMINYRFNIFYRNAKKCWDNNVFYIRYIFDILMFIYVIASCLFLINFR